MKYFDYAATAPVNLEVVNNVLKKYGQNAFGNPSSTHYTGQEAKTLLEQARKNIAEILKCKSSNIIFTSGGSESDNMALKGIMLKYKPQKAELITTTIEHPAILNTCKELEKLGYKIHYVKPRFNGVVIKSDIEKYINKKTKLISVMAVNNEVGTIQFVNEIGYLAHKYDILFHSDFVQGVGVVNIDLENIDLASFSAHKFGGLKGTGFLFKSDEVQSLEPLVAGGGQEFNFRSGTENVFGNLIMAECLKETVKKWKENKEEIEELRNSLYNDLKEIYREKLRINGSKFIRIPNNLNISFKDIDSRTLQLLLSNEGFEVSVGSACHSKSEEVSYVLENVNVPLDFINGSIRITLPPDTTKYDILALEKCIIKSVDYLYRIGD